MSIYFLRKKISSIIYDYIPKCNPSTLINMTDEILNVVEEEIKTRVHLETIHLLDHSDEDI